MNDERKPKQEPIGHATIPPALRPFLGGAAQAEEQRRSKNPAVDAAFAQIQDAIGEDVQEIDPDVGVGNASAYVGPVLVPDAAKGRAFTAKVKIIERQAESDRAPANDAVAERANADETTLEQDPPSSRGGMRLGGRTGRLMAQAAAEKAATEHAPPVSVPQAKAGSPQRGRSRGLAIAVAIASLGIVMAVGVWVVAKGPREVSNTPAPTASGSARVAPAVPVVDSTGTAAVVAPTPPSPTSLGTSEVDAGVKLPPSVPTGPAAAPSRPKGRGTPEDPYDAAAPVPAITAEPTAPPSPPSAPTAQPKPPASSNPFDKPNYD